MHSTSNLEDGYIGSGKRLCNSIRKYGKENHSIEILEWFSNRIELKNREIELVNEDMLNDSMCMNLALGGEGGFSKEASHKGALKMLSIIWNDENFRQRKSTEVSNRNSKLHEQGIMKPPSWKGRTHTDKYKKLIGEINSARQSGNKNSNAGKIWIYSLTEKKNLSIKKDEFNSYIEKGWLKGRKMDFYDKEKS